MRLEGRDLVPLEDLGAVSADLDCQALVLAEAVLAKAGLKAIRLPALGAGVIIAGHLGR